MATEQHPHVADLLPEYANGTLAQASAARVRAHVARCAACEGELREWERLAAAERFAAAHAGAPGLAALDRIFVAIDAPVVASTAPASVRRSPAARAFPALVHATLVLRGQLRLLRPSIWAASAAGIAVSTLVALGQTGQAGQVGVLAYALPLIAAVGVVFLYGPETDPGLELALATPTSPRLVLAARFVLLVAFDAALALVATLMLARAHGGAVWPLTQLWLGPMALLSALSLAISVAASPLIAAGGTATFWASRLYDGGRLALPAPGFWQTSPPALALAAALVVAALALAPRRERLPLVAD